MLAVRACVVDGLGGGASAGNMPETELFECRVRVQVERVFGACSLELLWMMLGEGVWQRAWALGLVYVLRWAGTMNKAFLPTSMPACVCVTT